MKTHTILMPLDMHLHLRDDIMLQNIAPLSAYSFSGALIMPNLVPPITSKKDVQNYKKRIMTSVVNNDFESYMTLFYKNYSRAFLQEIADDILAIKLYPAGVTTNSKNGVKDFDIEIMRETLEVMSELDIPLCVHGESN